MNLKEILGLKGILRQYERPTPTDILHKILRFAYQNTRFWMSLSHFFENMYFKSGWKFVSKQNNLIVNTGYNTIADRLADQGSYSSTSFGFFAWSDGTGTPVLTDTTSIFYADGSNNDTKAVASIDAFDVPNKTLQWNCFLSSTDNDVATIRKFAIMNDNPGTVMFNEILFTNPRSKNTSKELYFRYSLTFSQV